MRSVIICHAEDQIATKVMIRWLAHTSDLCGIVLIEEAGAAKWRRLKNEFRRSGLVGFLDVMLFRIYYKLKLADQDRHWTQKTIEEMTAQMSDISTDIPVFRTPSPNSSSCQTFIGSCNTDIALALCKFILKKDVFSLPKTGTFVLHPGVCPEYRNAHGCFWALANRDLDKVGMSLLKIDEGVDTGPVYEYFSYPYDEVDESHIVIQYSMTLKNLSAIAAKLHEIHEESPQPEDTSGRESHVWGQPTYTAFRRWKSAAHRNADVERARL